MTYEEWSQWTPCRRAEFRKRYPRSWPGLCRRLAGYSSTPTARLARLRFDRERHREVVAIARWRIAMRRLRMPKIIIELSAEAADVEVADILGMTRRRAATTARMAAAWMMQKRLNFGPAQIGRKLGGRDHSSVLHEVRTVDKDLEAGGTRFGPVVAYIEERLG